MLKHTHHDPYTNADVDEYGIGIELGHRDYGRANDGQPMVDADGNTGKDTVTAVMFRDGALRTFDVDQVSAVKAH